MSSRALIAEVTSPKMKGIGFANVHAYVCEQYGEATWQRVLNELKSDVRYEVEHAIAIGWYPVRCFADLLRAVDKVCGRGDLGLLKEIGAAEVEHDLNRVLRLFLRVFTPSQIFKVEARLWSHFQDSGTWQSIKVPNGVDATLTGWAVDLALCVELSGYLARLLELTGGRDVRVNHQRCRAKGHETCLFEMRFGERPKQAKGR